MAFNRKSVLKLYRIAGAFYLIPAILFALYVIYTIVFGKDEMSLMLLSILGLPPCSAVGLGGSIVGTVRSNKAKAIQTADTGIALIYLGIFLLIGGVIGTGFIWLMFEPAVA